MRLSAFLKEKSEEARRAGLEEGAVRFLVFERLSLSLTSYALAKDRELASEDEVALSRDLARYIEQKEPVQYILGYAYFLGERYEVGPGVLIPRFDTEALALCAERLVKTRAITRVADVGTGSGILALYLKGRVPSLEVVATDISPLALSWARKNARDLSRTVTFVETSILAGVPGPFGLIVANPPYIAPDEDVEELVTKEPRSALYAREAGLALYRRIMDSARSLLVPRGLLAFEIAPAREEGVRALSRADYRVLSVEADNAGRARVMVLERNDS